jgi:hypothetical protein
MKLHQLSFAVAAFCLVGGGLAYAVHLSMYYVLLDAAMAVVNVLLGIRALVTGEDGMPWQ